MKEESEGLPKTVKHQGKVYDVTYQERDLAWWERDIPEGGILVVDRRDKHVCLVDEVQEFENTAFFRYNGNVTVQVGDLGQYTPMTEQFFREHCMPQEGGPTSIDDIIPFCIPIKNILDADWENIVSRLKQLDVNIELSEVRYSIRHDSDYFGVDYEKDAFETNNPRSYSATNSAGDVRVYHTVKDLNLALDAIGEAE